MTFDCATDATLVLPGLFVLLGACLVLAHWGWGHRANAAKLARDLIWVTDEWKTRAREAEDQVAKLAMRIAQLEKERSQP